MHDGDSAGLDELRQELSRAFDFWNARCWDGQLVRPVINFNMQRPNSRVLGHYAADSWVPRDGRRKLQDEIVLYADLCLERGLADVVEVFVHEMVHLWQRAHGTPSPWGHHNREWHKEANRVGLQTTKGDGRGITTGDENFRIALREFAPRTMNTPHRRSAPQRGKMKKWVCGCGFAVRVAVRDFNAQCLTCGKPFREAAASW